MPPPLGWTVPLRWIYGVSSKCVAIIGINSINSSTHSCKRTMRCQEKKSGGTEWGSLQCSPRPPSWWGRKLSALSTRTPCSRPFGPHLFPHYKIVPLSAYHLMQTGDAPEYHTRYDWNLCFPAGRRLLFLQSSTGFGISYSGLYLNS